MQEVVHFFEELPSKIPTFLKKIQFAENIYNLVLAYFGKIVYNNGN